MKPEDQARQTREVGAAVRVSAYLPDDMSATEVGLVGAPTVKDIAGFDITIGQRDYRIFVVEHGN